MSAPTLTTTEFKNSMAEHEDMRAPVPLATKIKNNINKTKTEPDLARQPTRKLKSCTVFLFLCQNVMFKILK